MALAQRTCQREGVQLPGRSVLVHALSVGLAVVFACSSSDPAPPGDTLLPDRGDAAPAVPCAVAGAPCDDRDPCTERDACTETKACVGVPKSCTSVPQNACLDAVTYRSFETPGRCDRLT